MKKALHSLVFLIVLLPSIVLSQEVIINDFPIGVGNSVEKEFFLPYDLQLQAIADSLEKYPNVHAIITGTADGAKYRSSNDAKNPALALGRAHALRNLLVHHYLVDSTQLVLNSVDYYEEGAVYRSASVKIYWEIKELAARLKEIYERPRDIQQITEVNNIHHEVDEKMGLHLGSGISSSPFGGIPMLNLAVKWENKVFIEIIAGHTFWNNSYAFESLSLDTRRRMIGGQITIFPFNNRSEIIGLVAGWVRFEEISQEFYEFVKLSEGPLLGLKATPLDFLSITAAYNPAKHRVLGRKTSESKNNQFTLSVTASIGLGGSK